MEDAPFESLFDPDATLPYMLGDSEPNNAELSLNQGCDTENIPNTGTPDSGDLPDTELDKNRVVRAGIAILLRDTEINCFGHFQNFQTTPICNVHIIECLLLECLFFHVVICNVLCK